MEDLIPIGQFSAASRLSPKALRLYDEHGLLAPARVDPDSGYRFYRAEQLRAAGAVVIAHRSIRERPAPLTWAIVGAVLAARGRRELKNANPQLPETQQTLKEDAAWVKAQKS